MARLISYPIISTLSSEDLVIVSDSLETSYPTNNVTLGALSSFFDTNSSMWTPVAGGINYSGGNVGIGTVTPGFILDVRGSEAFIENVLTVGDEPDPVTDPTPNGSRIRVIGNSNTSANPGFIAIDKHPNGGDTKGVLFAERDSVMIGSLTNDPVRIVANNSEKMTILANGLVGIGTSNPGNQFNVIGTGNIGGSDLANSYILAGTITKGIGIDPNEIASKGGVLQIGTLDDKDVIIKANGAEAMRVDSDGNVGIGTASPGAKLDVDADALINGLTIGKGPGNLSQNVVLGIQALSNNTTGNTNTAIGSQALRSSTTGGNNVGVGNSALFQLQTSSSNTAVGSLALYYLQTGGNNTAIGWGAGGGRVGGTNASSTGSVFIGKSTISNGIGAVNEIVIGTDAISAGSNTVVLGNDLITSTRLKGDVIVANGNVGIGTTSPTSKLEVDGGDIEVDDSASGLILRSPDGTRYRITVANGGGLAVTSV